MLDVMTVRCGECGHENNPQYLFCGMCGARLRFSPPAAAEPPRETVQPRVSGPSFLGLADEPARNVAYLLEDEPRSHGRVFVALLLLLVTAGFLVWHWRRDGYPWAALRAGRAALSGAPAASSPAAASTSPAQPPATTTPQEEHTPTAPEKTEGAQQQPAPESQAANTAGAQSKASDSAPAQPGGRSDAAESAPKQSAESAAKPEEAGAAETQPAPKAKSAATAAPAAPKASKAEPQPAVSSTAYEDQMVADGEKYLYGNGVPQNCGRAQKNFLAAAQRSNPKAQSMLGAMYATGHCVTRDLPAAYRWFARALHQDPGNTRIARDLEILWKQMTPSERQIAQRSGQ